MKKMEEEEEEEELPAPESAVSKKYSNNFHKGRLDMNILYNKKKS